MKQYISNIENWVQGIIVILIAYNLTSYFFSKQKSALAYSIYLITVFVFLIPDIDNSISQYLYAKTKHIFDKVFWLIEIICTYTYFYFSYLFLELYNDKSIKKKFTLFFKWSLPISFLFFSIDYLFFNLQYFLTYNIFIYVPLCLFLATLIIKNIYKSKEAIKQLYLYSFITFIIFSLLSLYYTVNPESQIMNKIGIDDSHFFMIGVLIEVIMISIALGVKNLIYKKQSERSNLRLLNKLQENQKLQEQINQQLQSLIKEKTIEVNRVTKQSEEDKLIAIENKFKTKIDKLKLTNLLNQMNPHFIFNALNSIKLFIINNDVKNAVHYLNKFSKLIRKILDTSTHKETTLIEELETLDLYINIENLRFNNEINYIVKVSESIDLEKIKIPSLVLQPFLENAIWHGLSPKKSKKTIELEIKKCDINCLEINIKDNGIGRKRALKNKENRTIKRKSIGIEITKERLQNFVKGKVRGFDLKYIDLFDKKENPIGTLVKIKLPIE